MRNSIFTRLAVAIGFAAGAHESAHAVSTLGRNYDFTFEKGNLIRNWSFEQSLDNWFDESWSSTQVVTARKSAKSVPMPPVTGSFVGKFSGTNGTAGTLNAFQSDAFPVESGAAYTLSMYVWSNANTANLKPVILFYSSAALDAISPSYAGPAYFQNTNTWVLYGTSFTAPANCVYARLVLVQAAPSQGGNLYFDDLILEKGSVPVARDRIGESMTFWDDLGKAHQTQVLIGGGGNNAASRKYLVSGWDYDAHRYPARSFLPWVASGAPDYNGSQSSKSSAYNNGTNGMGDQGGYPYITTNYAEEPDARLVSSNQPSQKWQDKPMKSGSAFVDNLSAPASAENPAVPATEGQYLYQWNCDVEGRYSLSWSDVEGRLIQQASNLSGRWVYTRYEYYPSGNLKKMLTPYDDPADETNQDFRQVDNYNSAGQLTSTYTNGKGLVKYHYNRSGQIRFVQKNQYDRNVYSYTDYDLQDRPLSAGEQVVVDMDPVMAEERSTTGISKTEHAGYIYDDLATFQARLGFPYSDILPAGSVVGANASGRLVCDFALNDQVSYLPGDVKKHLVATFYSYNQYGEIVHAYKYIGLPSNSQDRIHHAIFAYDEFHRLVSKDLFDNSPAGPVLINTKKIAYDKFGRIAKITGLGGKFICAYQYFDWGGLKSVTLGGDGSSSAGTRIDYAYHAQGWVKEIDAYQQSTGALIFQQILGYEDKAVNHSVIPPLSQAKFDGSIAQQLYKFANDVKTLGPVRLTNYQYDDWGRMTTADSRKNGNSDPLDANQQINYAALSWLDTQDMDSRFQYDDIGRIVQNWSGYPSPNPADYYHVPGTYQLDHVIGKIGNTGNRDASPPGTFVYDSQGRMTEDHSKNMAIKYGWDDLPVEFTIGGGDGTQASEFQFYDASGNRVGHIQVKYTQLSNPGNAVRIIGHQEDVDPADLYNHTDLTAAYVFEQYMAGSDMLPPSLTSLTFYYVLDIGKTSMREQGEPDLDFRPITRSNGPPVDIKVTGILKGSLAYYDLLKKYVQGDVVSSTTDVNLIGGGDRRVVEDWSDGSVSLMHYSTGLFGEGNSVVGRINSGGAYEYFVKNHQGSTMKAVNEDGTFLAANNTTLDYLPYGDLLKLKDVGDKIQQEYTGKELVEFSRLYYFGARWFDPELALWLSPDPASQFLDPYGRGGDAVNTVDPDGGCALFVSGVQGGGNKEMQKYWDHCYEDVDGKPLDMAGYSKGYNHINDDFPWGHLYDAFEVPFGDAKGYRAMTHDMRHFKRQSRDHGEDFKVYAHSGGGNRSGYIAVLDGASRPDYIQFNCAPVTPGVKTILSIEGTQVDSRFGLNDPVSWMSAVEAAGEPNPFVGILQAINPDNWYLQAQPHNDQKALEGRSIGDMMADHPFITFFAAQDPIVQGTVAAGVTTIVGAGTTMAVALNGPFGWTVGQLSYFASNGDFANGGEDKFAQAMTGLWFFNPHFWDF